MSGEQLLVDALMRIASWDEGELGPHMDEPGAAHIAREALAAYRATLDTPTAAYEAQRDVGADETQKKETK